MRWYHFSEGVWSYYEGYDTCIGPEAAQLCWMCCITGHQLMPAMQLYHLALHVQAHQTHTRVDSVHLCMCVCVSLSVFQEHNFAVLALINISSCCLLQLVLGRKRELPADTDVTIRLL